MIEVRVNAAKPAIDQLGLLREISICTPYDRKNIWEIYEEIAPKL
tara:strand:+ start:221 stop:355 length:135 start_codon:yes stop_codon:yes gene_type:complete